MPSRKGRRFSPRHTYRGIFAPITCMSEYQRYEFMTCDRPLTKVQLDAVRALSSHIEATATHALIEYHWGDFKHNPIDVVHKFFDGFLYWANWGAPQLALRFPHGILPDDLLAQYDFDEYVTFTQHADYDILDIHFNEMEGPDEWEEYELGSLIAIRDELLTGDQRSLYIAWLAIQRMCGSAVSEEDDAISVPPAFSKLTTAQRALAELLQLPSELLSAAARHSLASPPAPVPESADDLIESITLLSPDQRDDFLVRLARNEPGLSHQLIRALRALRPDRASTTSASGEHVTYTTMLTESKAIKIQAERTKREQEEKAHQQHLQHIRDHQDEYWRQVDLAMARTSGAGYDKSAQLLDELRESANQFNDAQAFQARFRAWVGPHLRRPAFIKRLQANKFPLPEG